MLEIDIPASALLMLHCQNDIVKPEGKFAASGMPAQVAKHGLLKKWATLLKASREAGLRVIYVNNVFTPGFPELGPTPFPLMVGTRGYNAFLRGTWGAANPEEIAPCEGELVIDNYNSSAFSYTNLDLVLRVNGVRNLYLAGVATTFVINSSARYGAELGYQITVIADGCTSFSDDMHDFEINKVLPHFGTVCQSDELITGLKEGCG
jgi:nicotinamidase-related amidase